MREYNVRIGDRVHLMQLDDDDVKHYEVVEDPAETEVVEKSLVPKNKQASKPADK